MEADAAEEKVVLREEFLHILVISSAKIIKALKALVWQFSREPIYGIDSLKKKM